MIDSNFMSASLHHLHL